VPRFPPARWTPCRPRHPERASGRVANLPASLCRRSPPPCTWTRPKLIARIARLREIGAVTRFGPFFDAEAMGGAFCLCAMAVPQDRFDAVVTLVNALPEVAHNYERAHRLNMWFVLATERPEGIDKAAARIERETGLRVLRFPKEREFFIGFRVAA
jgi:hypothetical protein